MIMILSMIVIQMTSALIIKTLTPLNLFLIALAYK
jgi:hypothetical protein